MEEKKPTSTPKSDPAKLAAQSMQRLKFWIDFMKWFIVSVALVVVTTIIDWGFRDREAGLAELKFYDRYVTNLVVLNPSPVQKRQLALYFSTVTPSEKLRERWQVYYDSLYSDYIDYITPILEEESVLNLRYRALLKSQDSKDAELEELARIEFRLGEIRQVLYPEIKLPDYEEVTRESAK